MTEIALVTHHAPTPPHQGGTKIRRVWALALLGFIAINLLFFVGGDRNADWDAYEYLFNSGGGWLSDAGHDVGFIVFMKTIGYIGGYGSFRLVVGVYFLGFTIWIYKKWWPLLAASTHLWAFIGLLPLLIPRFTVQIREGVADTFVLAAFTVLYKREQRFSGLKALWPTVALLILAATIHSGAAIFLGALLTPYLVYRLTRRLGVRRFVAISVGLTVSFICFYIYLQGFDSIIGAIPKDMGDLDAGGDEAGSFNDPKVWYRWSRFIIVMVVILWVSKATYRQPAFSMFMRYMALAVLPISQAAILYLGYAGYPLAAISILSRFASTCFCVIFALTSLTTRATPINGLIVFIFLLDEYRVMTAYWFL
jgi:hypothetical protein